MICRLLDDTNKNNADPVYLPTYVSLYYSARDTADALCDLTDDMLLVW